MAVPVAFYAPLKSPDHPDPSGDRTMARLLLAALGQAGFAPAVASRLRALDRAGEAAIQAGIREAAEAEADALVVRWRAAPPAARPRLWFTYHCYYKAPDWIGPRVAQALAIPYAVAEGSRASKRAGGPWALGHAGAEAALDRADALLALTPGDRAALERARPARQAIHDLPPFLDLSALTGPEPRRRPSEQAPRLLAVGMMREGDKLASYRLLADALARAADAPWTLDVAGDGPARPAVETLFSGMAGRVRFRGLVADRAALAALYAGADLLVWPAVNEAYGMALLEAQALGCPVLAGAEGGVASVVRHGETGLLVSPRDADALAAGLRTLLAAPPRRAALGANAARFVACERTLGHAAERLRAALMPLVAGRSAA